MDKLARKVDIHHAAMQGSYFAGFSAIWGFGPVLLLYLGLSNSTLGVVTSLALVLSLLTLAAAVVMTVSTGSKTVLVAAYAVIGVLLVSTSPFFNSMVMEYHLRGVNVNYGLGRGTGSTTYAIVALVLGFVLEKRAPTVILPVLLAALVLQIIAVWTFRYPLPPPLWPRTCCFCWPGRRRCCTCRRRCNFSSSACSCRPPCTTRRRRWTPPIRPRDRA